MLALPVLSHSVLALALMAMVCPVLARLGNPHYGWYGHVMVSVFFFAREAAQAERALKPTLGDPAAFFLTLWPGYWGVGGARVSEWLAPAAVTFVLALLLHSQGERRLDLPREPGAKPGSGQG